MQLPQTSISLPELKIKLNQAIQKEQAATYDLLIWLSEVDLRRAYADWGFDSLWKMLLNFGYSESSASERIGALRLMQKIPDAGTLIKQGSLSFTTAAKVARFIRKENKEHGHMLLPEERTELVLQSVGKSKTELEDLFCKTIALKDPKRGMECKKLMTLSLTPEFEAKIIRMRQIKGHDLSHEFLLELALDAWLSKNDPDHKFGKKTKSDVSQLTDQMPNRLQNQIPDQINAKKINDGKQIIFDQKDLNTLGDSKALNNKMTPIQSGLIQIQSNLRVEFGQPKIKRRSRYIPSQVKRMAYLRDGGKCVECGTRALIQFDHKQRFVHFGEQTAENLELRCRAHNLNRG